MATHEKRGNSYRITVSLGYDLTGNQIRPRTTWTPTPGMTPLQEKKELERQKILFEERCKSGQVLDSNTKFVDFVETWFSNYAEKQLKAKTIASYKGLLKRTNLAIGHMKTSKIQPHHLLMFYDNLAESGIRDDTKYKASTDFKGLLKELNLNKSALAGKAGVSISVLDSLTNNKNINTASAGKIAASLNMNIKDIFTPAEGKDTLSNTTIRRYHQFISSVMHMAVNWGVIFSNPCERVQPPRIEKTEPRFLDDEQARILLELLDEEPPQYQAIIKVLLLTGIRRGEVCGLEWHDIDFGKSIIHILRESLYLPDKGVFVDDGKSSESIRSLKAPQIAMDVLREHKRWQAQERLKLGDRWQNCDRVFTGIKGQPIHPDTISGWFAKFMKRSDLPYISVHSLRHTNASLLIASGTPIVTVAKRLGHADANTTIRIYSHAIRSADAAAADTIQDILSPAKKSKKTAINPK
jgi:integrase